METAEDWEELRDFGKLGWAAGINQHELKAAAAVAPNRVRDNVSEVRSAEVAVRDEEIDGRRCGL
jgi:hypothetical protein